jgi:hypothetical protein
MPDPSDKKKMDKANDRDDEIMYKRPSLAVTRGILSFNA